MLRQLCIAFFLVPDYGLPFTSQELLHRRLGSPHERSNAATNLIETNIDESHGAARVLVEPFKQCVSHSLGDCSLKLQTVILRQRGWPRSSGLETEVIGRFTRKPDKGVSRWMAEMGVETLVLDVGR